MENIMEFLSVPKKVGTLNWNNQECSESLNTLYVLLPPATKLGQGYVFTSVCDSVHREGVCLGACWDNPRPGRNQEDPPPSSRHPPDQTPPRKRTLPTSRHSPAPGRDPQEQSTPPPPPETVHARRYGQTSGRYASYWNAYLFSLIFLVNKLQCCVCGFCDKWTSTNQVKQVL